MAGYSPQLRNAGDVLITATCTSVVDRAARGAGPGVTGAGLAYVATAGDVQTRLPRRGTDRMTLTSLRVSEDPPVAAEPLPRSGFRRPDESVRPGPPGGRWLGPAAGIDDEYGDPRRVIALPRCACACA